MMRRNVIGRLICIVSLCGALTGLSGCTSNKEEEPVTMPTESYKTYDVRSYMGEFILDGKKIGFPFQIEDLPENYAIQDEGEFTYENLEGKNECYVSYCKDGESMDMDILIKCRENENLIDDGKVYYISCRGVDEESVSYDFSIKGIGKGSTISEVIEELGEPSMAEENDTCKSIIYKQDEENVIVFFAYGGENINAMYMSCSLD